MPTATPPRRLGSPEDVDFELVQDVIPVEARPSIVSYMERASVLVAGGGYWTDPYTGSDLPYAEMTDGTYIWSAPWAFLVGRYGVQLPADFLAHMQALEFEPPEISDEELDQIGDAEGL
ncbi:hypothetical protein [Catenulispora pinistramenti]|uniref:hypothetical protein n=1 Tax=Catenulispora pinistramenti TaxID=2705254 RepID=UPI001BAD15E2|nr:hypothetical protein [Catenulispora pinistramenti]